MNQPNQSQSIQSVLPALSPEQLIKKAILQTVPEYFDEYMVPPLTTPEEVESAWDAAQEQDILQDATTEFRDGQVETPDIEVPFFRHCETKGVATQIDGIWVGWVFEYGGGKHFQESGNWLYDAYFLDCTETEKVVTVREFKKKN